VVAAQPHWIFPAWRLLGASVAFGSWLARTVVLAALAGGGAIGCAAEVDAEDAASEEAATTAGPSDPRATTATRVVHQNLRAFDFQSGDPFDHRVLLGQQEPDVSNRASYGGGPVRSDVEALGGRLPAVVSYELSNVTRGSTTPFDRAAFAAGRGALRELVLDKHRQGILTSFVWHLRCPKTRVTDPDRFAPADCPPDMRMEELLERKADGTRGAHFDAWRGMLDELAELLWSLKDERGELVPVLVRPFHEHTGGWFWWGRDNAPDVYARVWREMVTYLRDGRGLHSALWVYCPAAPSERSLRGMESYYPGDAYVDVVAFDRYDLGDGSFARGYAADLDLVGTFARRHGKLAAVAEIGRDLLHLPADPTWFTRAILAPLEGRSFAYVGLWRNAPWEKFVPEPGDGAIADDFRRMATDPRVLASGRHDLYRPLHAR